jgi:hypothetical protein
MNAQSGSRRPGLLQVVLALVVPAIVLLAYTDFKALHSQVSANAAEPLGLRVDRGSAQLRLDWNPASTPLASASEAELIIDDGAHRSQLLLSPVQIQSGSLLYAPFTDEIVFRMQTYRHERKEASESIRYSGQPAPASTPRSNALYAPGTVTVRAVIAEEFR